QNMVELDVVGGAIKLGRAGGVVVVGGGYTIVVKKARLADPAKHSLGRRINPIGWNDVARESQAARAVGVPGIRVVDAPCYARYIAIGSSRYRRCEVGVAGRIENPVGISDGHSATCELTPVRRLPGRQEAKFVLLAW